MFFISTAGLCLAGAIVGLIVGALRVGGLVAFLAMWATFAGLIVLAGSNPIGYLISAFGWILIGMVALVYIIIAVWASDHAANARPRRGRTRQT